MSHDPQHTVNDSDLEVSIDARAKACPQPVLMTLAALKNTRAEAFTVTVDNETAANNVARMARGQGCSVTLSHPEPERLVVQIFRDPPPAPAPLPPTSTNAEAENQTAQHRPLPPRPIIYLAADTIGTGDDALGRILMRSFIKTLPQLNPLPHTLILLNSAVRLCTHEAPLLDDLRELRDLGVRVLACGTCLDFFHLLDQVAVGEVGNMFEILSILAEAPAVIRP